MKVILLQEVKGLGGEGEVVEVAKGYARNYLVPKKLALEATDSNLKIFEEMKKAEAKREEKLYSETQLLAERLENLEVPVRVRVGEDGKLYGTVTAQAIVQALEAYEDIRLDRRKIEFFEPIKSTGTYVVGVKLYRDIESRLIVNVLPEEKPEKGVKK